MVTSIRYLLPLLCTTVTAQPLPVFYWTLDEASGTTAYASAGGVDGSLTGGVTWAPNNGHHQGAARFDGVNDRILLGACDLTNGQDLSISLWVKPDFVTGEERTIIAKTIGPQASEHIWSIAFVNATALRFRLRTGGVITDLQTPPSSLFGGAWYHLVATYDGAQMRLYANGALLANTTKNGTIGYHPQAPASLGAQSSGTYPISAWIDDVRIYDQALTDEDVLDLLFGTITTGITGTLAPTSANSSLFPTTGDDDEVLLFDMTGRRIDISGQVGTNTLEPWVIRAGLYLVCQRSKGERRIRRVVVQ